MRSEIRQDLVSGDWIIVATERSKRLHAMRPRWKMSHPKEGDPFAEPEKFGNVVVKTIGGDDWKIKIIKNKYPLVTPGVCGGVFNEGPFRYLEGVGMHEIIIYKDPGRDLFDFSAEEMTTAVKTWRDRYREILGEDECQRFTLIFHNYGAEAGASVLHPHSQIISVPVYPPELNRSLEGAQRYYKDNNKKVHQVMVKWEIKDGKRIVYENNKFVVLCPYASRLPYEARIYPKNFAACFGTLDDNDLKDFAEALSIILKKVHNGLDGLNDPPFNFYIHTAPEDKGLNCSASDFYTWHVEILPKISVLAGFELGTGIDVNVIGPEEAAETLRKA